MTLIDHDDSSKGGLFLNGSIHFLVYNYETLKEVIIAFDLKERRMSEISLSDDFRIYSFVYGEYDLLVLDGHIGAWMKDDHTLKIWMMREYGVHSSWTKIIEFSASSVSHGFFPICLTKCGDIVGTDSCYHHLVKFNDKGHLLEDNSCHIFFSYRSESVVYTESLLSLPGDIRPV
ncbi:F-box/kelch-repeat protein At3g06240-like [Vicia villosa]|uniref:F-box/kelch-repeat protein At3g06240-like n=1 Tax=Vicia villosa TaxID=3911 RepID=UPI00273A8668|nr:F-box/kelch-repeat protein At3g06240-like [Vicia villosa]